jgi:hypothetical protein
VKRSWPEIVAHIPRNVGSGDSLGRTVAESFGIRVESYSV